MPTSIIIDATHFGTGRPTGVETYTDNLLPELSILLAAKGWTVSWIGHALQPPAGMPKGVHWVHSPHKRFWSQTALLSELRARTPDIFFTPSGLAPVRYKGVVAVTIHDLAIYQDPASFTGGQEFRLRWLMALNAKKVKKILVPSQYTKNLAVKRWRLPEERVAVTPLAFEPGSAARQPVQGIPDSAQIILSVGRIERKKNLLPLIEGFAALKHDSAPLLVLAGGKGYAHAEIEKAIKKLPEEVAKRVFLPGYVSEGQKAWLYERAAAVAVPGLLEGFGLPVLEAFSYKAPVLCSQSGSLPEIAQDAALYVQGDIGSDWRINLERILGDEALAKELKRKGSERLKEFSWKQTVEKTVQALQSSVL